MTETDDEEDQTKPCPCETVNDNLLTIECASCKCYWHLKCCGFEGLTQQPINKLQSKAWKCPRCFELPIFIQPPKKPQISQEIIDNIVTIVNSTVETNLNVLLSSENINESNLGADATPVEEQFTLIQSRKRDKGIQKALQGQREEELLIEKKKDNLIVFGMPESNTEDKKDELLEDFRRIQKIYEGRTVLEQADIKHMTRLGEKKDRHIRPIQLVLTPNKRKDLLTKNLDLKLLENDTSTNIYVTTDRTKKQREDDKLLREELKRRKVTNPNLVIRNSKIVPFQDRAQATTTWASLFN